MDYPTKYSNDHRNSSDILRDLSIINQTAGCIKFVNTKGEESLTFSHKNGTYFRYDKFGREELVTRNERKHITGDSFSHHQGNVTNTFEQGVENIYLGDVITTIGDPDKWQPLVEEYKEKIKELHDDQRLFEIRRTKFHNAIDQAPLQVKEGILAPCPTDILTGQFLKSEQPSEVIARAIKKDCHRTIFKFKPTVDSYEIIPLGGENCFTCWGLGTSPSSQDGRWTAENIKKQITEKRIKLQEELYEIEKQLGQTKNPSGGTQIQNISKDLILNVGLVFNDFESFRKDPKGKLVPYGIKIDPLGKTVYTQYRESSLVELVDVERIPGGSYEINANHNFRITSGSGGIDFKTTGPLEMYSPIITVTSEAILYNSRGELSLGAERLDLSGDIITIRPNVVSRGIEDAGGNNVLLPANEKTLTEPEQQVMIDGNLNVGLNGIFRGGLHVEGEVSLHHISAPLEYQITESDFEIEIQKKCASVVGDEEVCIDEMIKGPTYADILEGCLIGYAHVGGGSSAGIWPVFSENAPNSVLVHPHYHTFKNLPLKLFEGGNEFAISVGEKLHEEIILSPHDAVRAVGARNNFAQPVTPLPINDSLTPTTVTEKFGGKCEPMNINNTSLVSVNRNDDKPIGEGVGTRNYSNQALQRKVQQLESQLQEMYSILKEKLSKSSEENVKI